MSTGQLVRSRMDTKIPTEAFRWYVVRPSAPVKRIRTLRRPLELVVHDHEMPEIALGPFDEEIL